VASFLSRIANFAQAFTKPHVGEVAKHSHVSSTGRLLYFRQHPDEWVQQHGLAWYKKIAHDPQVAASLDVLYSAVSSLWQSASGSIPSQDEWQTLLDATHYLPPVLQVQIISQAVIIAAPQVVPPPDPTPGEQKATEFVRYVVDSFLGHNQDFDTDITGRNFGRVLEETLSCIEDGKSVQELDWQKIQDGPWKGKWGFNDILWRYPDYFDFDTQNRLKMKQFLGAQATIPIPLHKMVVTAHNPKYENYHGESVLRSLSYPMDFKWNSESSCAIAEERFGMPTAVGWVDTDRSSTTLAEMITHLETLQRGQSIALNQDQQGKIEDVQFLETARRGGSSEYDVTIDRNNRYVSKVVLGSSLALEEGNSGAYSLAMATAAPNFRRKIGRLVNLLNWTHTTQTFAWLTWYNFPAGTRPPRLAIRLPQVWEWDPTQEQEASNA